MLVDEARAWSQWLRTFDWDWFATGTWSRPVGTQAAIDTVARWLQPLPRAYAAIGVQRGPTAEKYHVHAVIGGTGRHRDTALQLGGSWIHSGHVQLLGFTPKRGGIEYLVRQATEIELLGQPVLYRARR